MVLSSSMYSLVMLRSILHFCVVCFYSVFVFLLPLYVMA